MRKQDNISYITVNGHIIPVLPGQNPEKVKKQYIKNSDKSLYERLNIANEKR